MGTRKKPFNLKEPTAEQVGKSVEEIIDFVEVLVLRDYKRKCTKAEARLLRALYLTRANELVLDRNYDLRVSLYGEPGGEGAPPRPENASGQEDMSTHRKRRQKKSIS